MSKHLYIIASTTDGVGLEIEVFYTPEQTTKRLKALVDHGFRKPVPNEPPALYHAAYYEWIREKNDNMCETDIALHIEPIGDTATMLPAEPKTAHPEDASDLDDLQMGLFLALKTWRANLSSESSKPEAIIFQEATLRNIARVIPQTPEDLIKIKGVGPHKIVLYGDDLLAICNAFK